MRTNNSKQQQQKERFLFLLVLSGGFRQDADELSGSEGLHVADGVADHRADRLREIGSEDGD
jgi:hypothetical protein